MHAVRAYAASTSVKSATERIISFKLRDQNGHRFTDRVKLEMVVFTSAALTTPGGATLDTALLGTILDGGGSAALKLETADDGWFSCVVTRAMPGSVWVTVSDTYGGPVVESSDVLEVKF